MVIRNRLELKEVIELERSIYLPQGRRYILIFENDERYLIWKYLYYLRKEEYYYTRKGLINKIIRVNLTRRKNILGNKIDVKIQANMCGKGVNIHHKGIIINGFVGDNCIFHGRNVIGNNRMGGHDSMEVPHIGNNVDIGVGAIVIGAVTIADDVKIGANAVVNKSYDTHGSILVGIPAHCLNRS